MGLVAISVGEQQLAVGDEEPLDHLGAVARQDRCETAEGIGAALDVGVIGGEAQHLGQVVTVEVDVTGSNTNGVTRTFDRR